MPGTIQVSILELVGLPSLQQSSSMGIKVSMGKQAYDMQEKGDFSFVLASLRDNLSVTIHDSEGNEVANTGVDTRLIIEKGMWDDTFALQGGGHVRMRLHFILTEEEQRRIRSMRESAMRKKHEDLLKRSHSSSDLAVASGDSLKIRQAQESNVNPAGREANLVSPGFSAEVPSQVQPVQNKQAFSTSKSTGALDKLAGYQRVKKETSQQNVKHPSRLDKTPSSVRNMILAFESSPVEEASAAISKTKAASRLSSKTMTDIPLKAPKVINAVRAEPEFSSLETVSDPIPEEISTEREAVRDNVNAYQETLRSNTMTAIPLEAPKKTVAVITEQAMLNIETVHASILEKIVAEREGLGNYVDTETLHTPLNAPEKMVAVSLKPVFSNSETVPAPNSEEIVTGRGKGGDDIDAFQETLCSTTNSTTDTPLKAPKKTVAVIPIPILSKLESIPAPTSEEIVTGRGEAGDNIDAFRETLGSTITTGTPLIVPKKTIAVIPIQILSTLESEKIVTARDGVEGYIDPCQETLTQKTEQFRDPGVQPIQQISQEQNIPGMLSAKDLSRDEITPTKNLHSRLAAAGVRKFSWKILSRALPRHSAGKSFMGKQVSTSFDSLVFKTTWRRKHLKFSGHKSKVAWGKEYYSSGSFRGWIFLEEMIHSCARTVDRPLIDLLEGGYTQCCRDTIQEKLRDTDDMPSKANETSSAERSDNKPTIRPIRQAMNIAVMVGFGILVFLTRQRK